MDTWTWFQSGINTDGAHNPVTSRRIERGDILSLNCFPMIAGYYTALERTLFCEEASDEHLRIWEVNCLVHDEGKKRLVPGAVCGEVAQALNEIYAEYDLLKYRTFGYGHSFGVLCHYYGREAGLELREDIDTVLEPNMVVSMEPMLMLPEGLPGAGGYREPRHPRDHRRGRHQHHGLPVRTGAQHRPQGLDGDRPLRSGEQWWPVVQLAERLTLDQEVAGSRPARPASKAQVRWYGRLPGRRAGRRARPGCRSGSGGSRGP